MAGTLQNVRGLNLRPTPPPPTALDKPVSRPVLQNVQVAPRPAASPATAPRDLVAPRQEPIATAKLEQPAPPKSSEALYPTSSPVVDFLWKSEGRFDPKGNITPYKLPANDGGQWKGDDIEVAGMTPRYNKSERDTLLSMIKEGKPQDAIKAKYAEFVQKKTEGAKKLSDEPAIQEMARDIIYHRGDGGAKRIFKQAFGAKGPAGLSVEQQIKKLTEAARWYENNVVGYRANLAKGLENRFKSREQFALEILKSGQGKKPRIGEIDKGPYYAGVE